MAGEKFTLPNEQIEVRYIKKQKDLIKDPRHIAYGGLLEGSTIKYPARMLRNGTYQNVLTKEEKDFLEKALALNENSLSVYSKDNYWKNLKIRIGKEGLYLDLFNPEDYIKYKVLCSYEDQIALSLKEVDLKRTYRFVIIRKDDEAKETLKKIDVNKEAYKIFGKIEDNRNSMLDLLRISGLNVAEDTTIEGLTALVGGMVVKSPAKFISTYNDPNYHTKVLIFKAISKGEITKRGPYFYSKSGEPLCAPNQVATLDNAVAYLENNLYQEYRLNLMASIK